MSKLSAFVAIANLSNCGRESRHVSHRPPKRPGGRGSAAYFVAAFELKAAAESHAAPYDNFISQRTSDCESELKGFARLLLKQAMEAQSEQPDSLGQRK